MRILHLCADRGVAPDGTKGASVHLRSIGAALAANGHSVQTFTARRPLDANMPVRGWRKLEGLETVLLAADSTPDMIYERYALGHRDGLRAARVLGCPFVLEVNTPLVDETRRYRPDREVAHAAEIELELW